MDNPCERSALDLAAAGLRVVPLHWPDADGNCSCGEGPPPQHKPSGKHPLVRDWVRQASSDPQVIRVWWRCWPKANVGIVTGGDRVVLVLDIDGAIGEQNLAALTQEFGPLPDTLRVQSGRPGGYHLYFRYPGGPVHSPLMKGVDVRGDGGLIVVPPSLHHSGQRYQWPDVSGFSWDRVAELPEAWVEAVTSIGSTSTTRRATVKNPVRRRQPSVSEELQRLSIDPLPVPGLSLHMTVLVRQGDEFGEEYDSSSEVLQAIVTAAYNVGWDFETLYEILSDPVNVGGERMRDDHCPREYLTRSRGVAAQLAQQHPLPATGAGAVYVAEKVRGMIGGSGLLRATDSAVLEAHLGIVTRISSTKYGASVREVAVLAGVDKGTVLLSQKRLVQEGWLLPLPCSAQSGTSQWMISIEKVHSFASTCASSSLPMSTMTVRSLDPGHDAFAYKGLGKGGWKTLSALHGGVHTAKEIGAVTGCTVKTVRKHLARLQEVGLAVRDQQRQWHHRDRDLDEVAEELGVLGVGEQRRKRQARERVASSQRSLEPRGAGPRKVGSGGI